MVFRFCSRLIVTVAVVGAMLMASANGADAFGAVCPVSDPEAPPQPFSVCAYGEEPSCDGQPRNECRSPGCGWSDELNSCLGRFEYYCRYVAPRPGQYGEFRVQPNFELPPVPPDQPFCVYEYLEYAHGCPIDDRKLRDIIETSQAHRKIPQVQYVRAGCAVFSAVPRGEVQGLRNRLLAVYNELNHFVDFTPNLAVYTFAAQRDFIGRPDGFTLPWYAFKLSQGEEITGETPFFCSDLRRGGSDLCSPVVNNGTQIVCMDDETFSPRCLLKQCIGVRGEWVDHRFVNCDGTPSYAPQWTAVSVGKANARAVDSLFPRFVGVFGSIFDAIRGAGFWLGFGR